MNDFIKAAFKIVVNGDDITNIIADRVESITTVDAAGLNSDNASIVLDDRDQVIALPSRGVEMEVWLGGYVGSVPKLELEGLFIIDEVATSDREGTLSIHGKATDMLGSLKAPHDESYTEITFKDLVEIIAARHDYEPVIHESIANKTYPQIDQLGQSDIDLLTSKALESGAICKPTGKRLCILPEDASETASGTSLPDLPLDGSAEGLYIDASIQERSQYGSVRAYWQDMDDTTKQELIVGGGGEPVWSMQEVFQTQELAINAANSKLARLQRGGTELSIEMRGDASFRAERIVKLFNHRHAGRYVIKEATKNVNSGQAFTASLTLVEPRPVYEA